MGPKRDRGEVTRYRPAQGSFSSLISANDFVHQTLQDDRTTVDAVASGRLGDAMLEKRFGYVTGKEAYRPTGDSEVYIRNTYGVRIIIQHALRAERGYSVYTAFPVNEYVRKK
jgi:hypothetical protein